MMKKNTQAYANDVAKISAKLALVGIIGNILLALFKFFAGIYGHSTAMISDAIHTLSDIFATFIAWLGLRLSRRGADHEHPYGHDRLECVASLLLATILAVTGLSVGLNCLRTILNAGTVTPQSPDIIAIIAAATSILVKEGMFWYTMYYARIISSNAFRADAWHHRSDALSSIGALVGIVGARMGYPLLDSLAGIFICVVILIVALRIFHDAISKMLDTSCDDAYVKQIRTCIEETLLLYGENCRIDVLRTRKFGEKVYIEVELGLDGNMSLNDAHEIAQKVHDQIEQNFPDTKHVMVHMNPNMG